MDIQSFFSNNVNQGCKLEEISSTQQKLGIKFPQWYIDYLLNFNGAEANFGLNKLGYLQMPDGDDFPLFPIYQFLMLEKSVNYYEEFDLKEYNLFPFGACEGNFLLCFDVLDYKIFLCEMDDFLNYYIALNFEKLKERIIASSRDKEKSNVRYDLYLLAEELINGNLPDLFFNFIMRWDWADKSAKYSNISATDLHFIGLSLEKSNQLWTEEMKDLKFYPFGTNDHESYFGFNVDDQKVYLLSRPNQMKLLNNNFKDFLADLQEKEWEVWKEW